MKLSCFFFPGILITVVACLSCSKSSNGSKPKISIESINNPVQPDQALDVNLKFSNGSQLSKGVLVVIRNRTNLIPPPPQVALSGSDTLHFNIPEFAADNGEMEFTQ